VSGTYSLQVQPDTEDINPRLAGGAIFFTVAVCTLSLSAVLLLTKTGAAAVWVAVGSALAIIAGMALGLGLARYQSGTAATDNRPVQVGGCAMLLTGLGAFRSDSGFAALLGLLGVLSLAVAINALVLYRDGR